MQNFILSVSFSSSPPSIQPWNYYYSLIPLLNYFLKLQSQTNCPFEFSLVLSLWFDVFRRQAIAHNNYVYVLLIYLFCFELFNSRLKSISINSSGLTIPERFGRNMSADFCCPGRRMSRAVCAWLNTLDSWAGDALLESSNPPTSQPGPQPDPYRIPTGSEPDTNRIGTGAQPVSCRMYAGYIPGVYRIGAGSIPDKTRPLQTGSASIGNGQIAKSTNHQIDKWPGRLV